VAAAKSGSLAAARLMIWRASGEVAERKMMDSKASPSLAQPGMFRRSSLINSMHAWLSRTFS
jgi:hypothetical protein